MIHEALEREEKASYSKTTVDVSRNHDRQVDFSLRKIHLQ